MTVVTSSTTINAPAAKVFDFLVTPENHKKWQPALLEVSVTPAGPIGIGSIYHYVTQVMGNKYPSQIQISGYEVNKKWAYKTTGVPNPVETVYTFEAAGTATNVTISMDVPANAYPAAAAPMIMQQMQKSLVDQCAALKKALE
ncbi:MAG TPA: SRPBCC family protein [Anaerolineae bacterium]|nr:SRPBCC family protein [Anaerolineae bacterium]